MPWQCHQWSSLQSCADAMYHAAACTQQVEKLLRSIARISNLEACLGCKEGDVCEETGPGHEGPAGCPHNKHQRLPTDGHLQSAGRLHVSHLSACGEPLKEPWLIRHFHHAGPKGHRAAGCLQGPACLSIPALDPAPAGQPTRRMAVVHMPASQLCCCPGSSISKKTRSRPQSTLHGQECSLSAHEPCSYITSELQSGSSCRQNCSAACDTSLPTKGRSNLTSSECCSAALWSGMAA